MTIKRSPNNQGQSSKTTERNKLKSIHQQQMMTNMDKATIPRRIVSKIKQRQAQTHQLENEGQEVAQLQRKPNNLQASIKMMTIAISWSRSKTKEHNQLESMHQQKRMTIWIMLLYQKE